MDTSPSSNSVGIIDRRPSECLAKPGWLWPPEVGWDRKKVRYRPYRRYTGRNIAYAKAYSCRSIRFRIGYTTCFFGMEGLTRRRFSRISRMHLGQLVEILVMASLGAAQAKKATENGVSRDSRTTVDRISRLACAQWQWPMPPAPRANEPPARHPPPPPATARRTQNPSLVT